MSKCADLILKIFRSGDCDANKGREELCLEVWMEQDDYFINI